LMVAMAGADYVHLAAGMLDSGNSISYEQFIIDNEILGMVHRLISGVDVNQETLAVDIIENIGPGGNYITEEHSIKHMFTQFFYPTLAIRMNFNRWQEQDEPTSLTNAHELVRKWLEEIEPVLSLEKLLEIKRKFPEIVNT